MEWRCRARLRILCDAAKFTVFVLEDNALDEEQVKDMFFRPPNVPVVKSRYVEV